MHRTRQTIIEAGESANFNCSIVNFSQGCNTGWHVHDCDQILIVTSGSGWVATENERLEIKVGDVAETVVERGDYPPEKIKAILGGETVAVLGYGVQGRGQSLNMKDNGGPRPGRSRGNQRQPDHPCRERDGRA